MIRQSTAILFVAVMTASGAAQADRNGGAAATPETTAREANAAEGILQYLGKTFAERHTKDFWWNPDADKYSYVIGKPAKGQNGIKPISVFKAVSRVEAGKPIILQPLHSPQVAVGKKLMEPEDPGDFEPYWQTVYDFRDNADRPDPGMTASRVSSPKQLVRWWKLEGRKYLQTKNPSSNSRVPKFDPYRVGVMSRIAAAIQRPFGRK